VKNFFGFHFSTKNQNISALNEQLLAPSVTLADSNTKKSKALLPTTQHLHLKKMEEHRRNLRAMYFSS